MSPEIQKYIENEILPKYAGLGGHTSEHIEHVIANSMHFAKQASDINLDMAYVIAAYHDLGRLVDDETHNIESAKMLRADEFLRTRFSADEIEIMAEAVEDHRASLGREPRSIYGKIVSSADRYMTVEEMLDRVWDYNRHLHPEFSEEETIEDARIHLREKFAPDGCAVKTVYFDWPEFNAILERVGEITKDYKSFAKAMRAHNKKRFKK